ncbi:MAG: hypothetical protein DMG17_22205 [Acidobacteria bacterium]|nr:MAG: hypothetical protein DMG17_22205 [Acidobacteriota bacterium]
MREAAFPQARSNGKTQRERDWSVILQRGTDAIYAVFESTAANYEQLGPAFERMLRRVQFR